MDKLPNHVPVLIDPSDIRKFEEYLDSKGYEWVFLQVVKPRQIMGKVKSMERNGREIEHHVRLFIDGKITTEFELPRVRDMWMHLTTVSYSAHELIMKYLDDAGIEYKFDDELRLRYNKFAHDDYPRRYAEFVEWLFAGVLFWSPLGYTWKFLYNLRRKFNGKTNHKF